jgi:heme/copper-type cytochrome/quinol oxidase subunit 1
MPIFFVGLGIFGVGFAILVVFSFALSLTSSQADLSQREKEQTPAVEDQYRGERALRFGIFTALLTALIAIIALIWSYLGIPSDKIGGQYYYELLFWGSGHIIQFTHTQLMLVAWLWLATISGTVLYLNPRVAIFLFALGAAPTLLTPFIYLSYEMTSPNHIISFTWLMQYGGGLAALPFGLIIVLGILKSKPAPTSVRAEKAALIFSILLFGVGGVIGFLITGSNVTVPAHYHGSIVGVTLAFMAITYHLMPRLGFREVSGKWARWQPTIYGIGQLMHVLGLAWAGGYGVKRKTAGAAQGLESLQQQLGMGLMGLGGMIAIIGGIIFLVVVFLAMRPQR